MLVLVFLFVTIYNWESVLNRQLSFRDAVTQCGQALFKIGPIQDMANMLIAGSYYTYLGKVDYRDEQINIMATRTVALANDDELQKTRDLLLFVSNKIHYVSDPDDGLEYAKKPITTLIAGGGDCEDQTLLLCTMMESVGLKTYIAFTDQHVFALVRFTKTHPELKVKPTVYMDDTPLYALDPSDRDAQIGYTSVQSSQIRRIFDVSRRLPIEFRYTDAP